MRGTRDRRSRLYVGGLQPSSLPEAGDTGEGPTAWWATPYGSWRLEREREAMARFAGFRTGEVAGCLVWDGRLRTSLNETIYPVRVIYPPTFPDEAPFVVIRHQFPEATPHLLSGGRPCLYEQSRGPRHGYDPARTTAGTLVAWTALWLHAFETWRATRVWPGAAT